LRALGMLSLIRESRSSRRALRGATNRRSQEFPNAEPPSSATVEDLNVP
jgi:hypothetical protein